MNSRKNINILLIIIAVLVVALAACIGYIMGTDVKSGKSTVVVRPDNEKIKKEMEALKAVYDAKINEKTTLYKELEIEKEKVRVLVQELDKTKSDAQLLLKYKNEYKTLEGKMFILIDEIKKLKTQKAKVVSPTKFKTNAVKRDLPQTPPAIGSTEPQKIVAPSIKKEITNAKPTATTVAKTEVIAEKVKTIKSSIDPIVPVKKGDKTDTPVIISNVKSVAYHLVGFDKYDIAVTSLAKKTDLIRISFTLDANTDAKSEQKKYYIQVINSKNNVVGIGTTEYFDDSSLTYSFSKTAFYNGQSITLSHDLVAKSFDKGNYTINIYERNKLVGKTNLSLQ